MKAGTRKRAGKDHAMSADFEVDIYDDSADAIDTEFIEDVYNEVNKIRGPIPAMEDSGSYLVDDDEAFDNWLKRGRIVKYLSYH